MLMLIITNCRHIANDNSERTNSDDEENEKISDVINYHRKWIVIKDEEKNQKQQMEVYISELGDTIYNQNKFFVNGKLDSTKSNFYELDLSAKTNGEYKGKIKIHSGYIHNIESPITRRRLQLYLLNREDSINTDFESINMNNIKFSYSSSNDTLIGILLDMIEIDTVIDGENMVRLLESRYYLDNKSETLNTLINEFEKNKN
ncbi:hypothetical protein [Salegentibacter flavus]|uniref:Uncharacterized protein n=1 Tax=Salegentibacter flavus TaxID=287099 RepID=A0A1I4ZCZ2_9FLAO|nr:hypothetical protein [Salegentibacter flavus]SFN48134.1 hypothetical protein SAMN05660413_01241 [Salegentibacter flavus]